tara:strand:- start:517 stop:708 length:192 start_codon:yes stop_codon:yes gene_type:complete
MNNPDTPEVRGWTTCPNCGEEFEYNIDDWFKHEDQWCETNKGKVIMCCQVKCMQEHKPEIDHL